MLVLIAVLHLSTRSQQPRDASTVRGTVRDSQGKPVAAAMVELRSKGAAPAQTAHTDSQGNYSFAGMHQGVYEVRAEMHGLGAAGIASLFVGANETKTVDFTLLPSHTAPPQSAQAAAFFDQPQFTVAGVTDTTNLGGHGSDTVVRTRETIARETATLGKTPTGPPPAAPIETEKSLQEKLERQPNNAALHHSLGDFEEGLGHSLEAVREYQRAAELDPAEPYVFDWGSELLLHHAPEPAREVFRRGNRLFPHSVRMLVGLGASWFAAGEPDQAVARICEASDLNPDDAAPYLFLGKIQNVASPPAELVERLHRFATLQPQSADANYYYAVGLWKRRPGPQDAASAAQVEALLKKAIQLDPKFGEAYLQLGILDSERRDFPAAISNYRQAVQTAPQMEEAHYRLAQAYRQMGEADKAKTEFQIYDQMAKESAQRIERERHEIRQFVYTLRDQPASPPR